MSASRTVRRDVDRPDTQATEKKDESVSGLAVSVHRRERSAPLKFFTKMFVRSDPDIPAAFAAEFRYSSFGIFIIPCTSTNHIISAAVLPGEVVLDNPVHSYLFNPVHS